MKEENDKKTTLEQYENVNEVVLNKNETQESKEQKGKNKDKKILIINIILVIAICIGVTIYMINVDGIDNIVAVLKAADYKWVLIGLLCLIGMWIAEAITVHIPIKKLYPDNKFSTSFKATMVGQLFNNLTPFASGGQLMEAYEFSKSGKRVSDALSILSMKFVIAQTTLIIFTMLVVISQFSFFAEAFKSYVWIGIIGILLNILIIILLFLAGTKKEFVMRISRSIIKLVGKIRIGKFRFIKDVDAKIEKFDESVTNFSNQFKEMKKQRKTVIEIAIIGLIQSILYYAITYMVYRAFGNSGTNFLQIITVQAFLMLIMTVTPTPGAGLGAEGGFFLLFNSIFKNGTINMSILFWRIYIFYLPIIVGALFMIPSKKDKQKIEIKLK